MPPLSENRLRRRGGEEKPKKEPIRVTWGEYERQSNNQNNQNNQNNGENTKTTMCDTDYGGWAIREERDPVKRMARLQEDPFVAPEIKKAAAKEVEKLAVPAMLRSHSWVAPETKDPEAMPVNGVLQWRRGLHLAHPAPATPPAPKRARAAPDAPKKPDTVVLREVASASVRVRVSDDLTPTVLGTTVTHPSLIHRGTTVTSAREEEERRSGFWKRGGENEAHGMRAVLKCSCGRPITIRVECLENKDSDSSDSGSD